MAKDKETKVLEDASKAMRDANRTIESYNKILSLLNEFLSTSMNKEQFRTKLYKII